MKTTNRFSILLAIAVMMTAIGCASTTTKEGTDEYVDDSVITTKVVAAIFNDPDLKSAEINVETFKGVVQLSGFVKDRTNISKAVFVAGSVNGVTAVNNDLRLK